jgi:hypothetical protein
MKPTTKLATRTLSLLAIALLAAGPAAAQATGNAVQGRLLFNDTPGVSGISTLTASCAGCHMTVQNRRTAVGGSVYANISFDTAINELIQAIQNVGGMGQYQVLDIQNVRDLAAYIADTPKVSATRLDFTATAVNTATPAQSVELRHSLATELRLRVESVAVAGPGAARFTIASNTCPVSPATVAVAGICAVGITFSAPDTAGSQATLTFTLREAGASTSFTRSVTLDGAVAVTAPSSGGGALGLGWLAALATATLAAAAAGRRTRRRS